VLLSSFPENGTPLVVLGDFNNHLEKSQSADFHTLLASFDLKGVFIAATYKSGNQLDLIYMHFCSTDHTLVTPLHTSDHFLLTLLIPTCLRTQHTPAVYPYQPIQFRPHVTKIMSNIALK